MKVRIRNRREAQIVVAEVLSTPWARARGYLFRRPPHRHEGLFFLYPRPRRVAIHMWGVPFPLTVVWIGENTKVVGVTTVKPWVGFAVSPSVVMGFLETRAGCTTFAPGDLVVWEEL